MSRPSGGTPQVLGMRPVDLHVHVNTLQLYFDCEILKLVYQMKSGETLDLNVVDRNEKITEIKATKKKSKINREVSVLTVKGDNLLKFQEDGVVCCLLGEEVDLAEKNSRKKSSNETLQRQGASCISATSEKSDEGTQTDLNPKDTCIKCLQSSLSNERMENVHADVTEAVSCGKSPRRSTGGVSDTSKLMKLASEEKAVETECKRQPEMSSGLALVGDTGRQEARKRKRGQPKKIEKTTGNDNLDSVICDVLLEGTSVKNDGTGSETSAQQVITKKGRLVRKPLHLRDADNVLVEHENQDEVLKIEEWTPTISADSEVRPAAVKRARKKKGAEKSDSTSNVDSDKPQKKAKRSQCPVCGKMVTNIYSHTQIHSGPYNCTLCDKTFTAIPNLRRHVAVVHDRKYALHCDQCGKGYMWKRDLLEHIERAHKDGDPDQTTYFPRVHVCEYCNKAFKHSGARKAHINAVHKKLRSYACDVCDKKFAKRYHLNVHLRTHSGEKPYLCSFCGRGFADKGNMDVHIQSVHLHNKLPYKCDTCGMEFRRKKFLSVHLERGHSETGNPAPQQRQTSFRKKKKSSKTMMTREEAIMHLPLQQANLVEKVQLQLQRPVIRVKQETVQPDMQHDVLKLAVEQLSVDVSESCAEKQSSQTVVKTEFVVTNESVGGEEVGVVHVVGQAVEPLPGDASHSLTVKEIEETSLPTAQSADTSVWPENTAADNSAEYITVSETEPEGMVIGQEIPENLQQQPFRILELEGDTQPYLVIQGQDGTLTTCMLQSVSADSVVDVDVVEAQNSVVS